MRRIATFLLGVLFLNILLVSKSYAYDLDSTKVKTSATIEAKEVSNSTSNLKIQDTHTLGGGLITPFSDAPGGGAGGGKYTYLGSGVVLFEHGSCCKNVVLYLPSDFIARLERAGNSGATVAGLIGLSASNPITAAIAVVIGANWGSVLWYDKGAGVSVLLNGNLTFWLKMQSGRNYFMH